MKVVGERDGQVVELTVQSTEKVRLRRLRVVDGRCVSVEMEMTSCY